MGNLDDLTAHFHIPLSEEAYEQFQQLELLLHNTGLVSEHDIWQLPQGAHAYSVSKTYKLLVTYPEPIPVVKWLWKTCCQLRHKIFYWLLIFKRLNTRAMLQRINFFIEDYTCVMCNHRSLETRDHLLFQCPYDQLCWQYVCPSL